jgi:peptidoglycan lytic transglycosylase
MSYKFCATLTASLMLTFISAVPSALEAQSEPSVLAAAVEEFASDDAPTPASVVSEQTGIASWYGIHWQGRKTASGVRFDVEKLTAAHRTLPLNTTVRVTNLLNGASVVVLVNDRGPYVGKRVIDLSEAAAKALNMVRKGLVPVRIEIIEPA